MIFCNECKYYKWPEIQGVAYCSKVKSYSPKPSHMQPIFYEHEETNKDNDCEHFEPSLLKRILSLGRKS